MFTSPKIASTITILAVALAFPALAQDTMSAAEFDDYTRGKTLFYGQSGAPYGAEIYLDNRRVKWSFLDGECKEGEWYEDAGQICFVYEDTPDPQCWTFNASPSGLIARFRGLLETTELYEASDLGEEMICLGPRIGV